MNSSLKVFCPVGRLSGDYGAQFYNEVSCSLEYTGTNVLINLQEVTFIDLPTLGMMLKLYKKAQVYQAGFALCSATPPVQALLELTGLDKVVEIFENLAEAYGEPPGVSTASSSENDVCE
ncbi:MAG: STAS domain-containing protein [Leptolyngbyaceae bacterium]|nr:STAS domain-containing protein [Leptolyngbyaceae bacterium]